MLFWAGIMGRSLLSPVNCPAYRMIALLSLAYRLSLELETLVLAVEANTRPAATSCSSWLLSTVKLSSVSRPSRYIWLNRSMASRYSGVV